MTSGDLITLRRHKLSHLSDLRVQPDFLSPKFAAGCSMANCDATCCKNGVMLDVEERDKILRNAEVVRKYMEPHQDKDSVHWFSESEEDKDFPSGRAVHTRVKSYGCVFLDGGGRCVLQKAAMGEGMPKYSLKPFFCATYPVTIEDGQLIIDDPDFTFRTQCCSTVERGSLTVLDVCSEELEFMLGSEGISELKQVSIEQKKQGT